MQKNRLNLNFALNTQQERSAFVTSYIQNSPLHFTDEELDTMGTYILWGKDASTGLNAKQDGSVELESTHSEPKKIESIEGILSENPLTAELQLSTANSNTIYAVSKRSRLSRDQVLAKCDPELRDYFHKLFHHIDTTELGINFYEIERGRRTKPPREKLLAKFTPEEIAHIQQSAATWTSYRYLQQRHLLIELRRDQYSLNDLNSTEGRHMIAVNSVVLDSALSHAALESGIEVLPLGLAHSTEVSALIFRPLCSLNTHSFNEQGMRQITDFYWRKKNFHPSGTQTFFDFREKEHVYQVILAARSLGELADEEPFDSQLRQFIDTLQFYIEQAELSPMLADILQMKMDKIQNIEIADYINRKYNKSYTPNYISTIFRQKIIEKINKAACLHEQYIEHLPFAEDFKVCAQCGQTMLLTTDFFRHQARTKDGFSLRCKKCELGKEDNL